MSEPAGRTEGPKGQGPLSAKHRWGTGRRPGGPPPRKEGFGPAAGLGGRRHR